MIATNPVSLLEDFRIDPAPSGLAVLIKGSPAYISILRQAFPAAQMYGPYPAFAKGFDNLVYVHQVTEGELIRFLSFCQETLFVVTTLDECWALDRHMGNGEGRTEIGDLTYHAKTYKGYFGVSKPGDPDKAAELAQLMADRYCNHPRICSADQIVGVPANPKREPHNLPEMLAHQLRFRLGVALGEGLLEKVIPTGQMKEGADDEKLVEMINAYRVTVDCTGETIVVVDDLLRSGTTLGVIAEKLRQAGAKTIIGVVATKTMRN